MDDLLRGLESPSWANGLLPKLARVNPVNGEQIDMIELEITHRRVETRPEAPLDIG